MANPIYCLSESAIVPEETWIAAGAKLIRRSELSSICGMVIASLRQTF